MEAKFLEQLKDFDFKGLVREDRNIVLDGLNGVNGLVAIEKSSVPKGGRPLPLKEAIEKVGKAHVGSYAHNLRSSSATGETLQYWMIDRDAILDALVMDNGKIHAGLVFYPALHEEKNDAGEIVKRYHSLVFGPVTKENQDIDIYKILNDDEIFDYVEPCPDFCAINPSENLVDKYLNP